MIDYDPGAWGVCFICRLHGSVLPKALVWAIPNAILAAVCHIFLREPSEDGSRSLLGMDEVDKIWNGYTFVLGFLIVFRNNQAYSRFWQGAQLLGEIHASWFDAVSELFAFCTNDVAMQPQVLDLQHMLIKLASMLFSSALQDICETEDDALEIVNPAGLDPESLAYLVESENRTEVIMQWIQTVVVEYSGNGTLAVPAPILSRVYQELSSGMVKLHNARIIKSVPFPFPYAQMITGMLILHWFITPLFASQIIGSPWWAAIICFCVTASFWTLLYIALEIDQPFGEDANDLPVKQMMHKFNQSITSLMHPLVGHRPKFTRKKSRADMGRIELRTARTQISLLCGDQPDSDAGIRNDPEYGDPDDGDSEYSESDLMSTRSTMADVAESCGVHRTSLASQLSKKARLSAKQQPSLEGNLSSGTPEDLHPGLIGQRPPEAPPATQGELPSGTPDDLHPGLIGQRPLKAFATQEIPVPSDCGGSQDFTAHAHGTEASKWSDDTMEAPAQPRSTCRDAPGAAIRAALPVPAPFKRQPLNEEGLRTEACL